jgi:DNA polymerase gamma 1
MGYPVVYLGRSCGWCFRVPKEESSDSKFNNLNPVQETEFIIKETKSNTEPSETVYKNLFLEDMDRFVFYRMPSNNSGKDSNANCGSPFAKMFVNSFDEGKMDAEDSIAKEAISANAECSYWISARERIKSQFVVWNNGHPEEGGAIIPPVIAMGTVTRRAVESTWLTASNAKKTRIGSELKTMVRPPEGYVIIGADVDSQELWIASLLGDAQFGFHGATGFGWMTLQGSKKDGTDLHSKSAAILKASRDHAKIFNYARIYGSGLKFSASLLCKCNPSISAELAAQRAQDLYAKTKGLRYFPRRDPVYNLSGSSFLKNKFSRAFWYGGSESYMFNSLEDVANSSDPRTPVLKCQLPDSLMPLEARKKYSTSCINWVVQSSGVDYFHLLLVSVKHLASQYGIRMRLMLTIHDEVRFLVAEEDALRACYALQISNMWTRALFAKSVGMSDLPWVSHLVSPCKSLVCCLLFVS